MRIITSLLAAAITALALARPPVPPGQPEPASTKRDVSERQTAFVVEISALDSAKALREIRAVVEKFRQSRAPALVLAINASTPWRSDIVRELLLEIKSFPSPVTVYLTGFDERKPVATLGPVLLATAASQFACDRADFSVLGDRDTTPRSLVAEKTDWSAIEHDIRDLIAPHITRRRWAEGALEVLTWADEDWWAIEQTASKPSLWTLAKGQHPVDAKKVAKGASVIPLNKGPRVGQAFESFTVPFAALSGPSGEAFLHAEDVNTLCRMTKLKAPLIKDAEVIGTVGDAASQAGLIDDDLMLARAHIDQQLDTAESQDTRPSIARSNAAAQLENLRIAEESIHRLETLLAEYPEMLRHPPPGYKSAGMRPATMPARWRSLLQSHHDAVVKLRARAQAILGDK